MRRIRRREIDSDVDRYQFEISSLARCLAGGSEELLGHICAAPFIDNVRPGEEELEGDDEEDEEAHSRGGGGDDCFGQY